MIIAAVASNLVALLLLFLSWKRKNTARLLFAMLFFWASVTNRMTATQYPDTYLEYGKYAIPLYKKIINGEFSSHITGYVCTIAVAQLLIALGLLARGMVVKISCIGGMIFLLAIAPLGLGAAFPFSIIAALALFILYRHYFPKDIFKNKWWV